MKHILDFTKSDEETAISRILALVHQAVDREFPRADPAPTRFAKTAFGDEPTLNEPLPEEILFSQTEERLKRLNNDPLARTTAELQQEAFRESQEKTETAPFPAPQQRQIKQTIIAIFVLGIGLLISYLIWNQK